jgi:HSP20 family protein
VSHPKHSGPFAELHGDFSDRLRGDRWQPDADVFETDEDIVVRVELSGVRSEDLRVTVDGSVLGISGVRIPEDSSEVKRLHQMEIATGPFERRFSLPVAFDRDQVSAYIVDGFLTIRLAKRLPVRRSVEVETEE